MEKQRGTEGVFHPSSRTIPLANLASLTSVSPASRLDDSLQDTLQAGKSILAGESTSSLAGHRRVTVLHAGVNESAGESSPRFLEMQLLGRGAMGEVVLARDNDIGREVAIKRLLPERSDDIYQAAFAGEVRTIGALDHPNIVPVYDVDIDEHGRRFVVMKRVHGETLEDIIEALRRGEPAYQERFPIEQRVGIILELLRGLACAHQQGILHRDIKPANIMVGPTGEVTLMDWGIAASIEELRRNAEGGLAGTPIYMSPEQARGELAVLDQRSDLYCICAVFFELCTLETVVQDPNLSTIQILAQVGTGTLVDVYEAWARLTKRMHAPRGYSHILWRGLAFEANERFASAEELAAAILQERDGHGQIHCAATFQVRMMRSAARWANRNPMLAMLLPMMIVVTWLAAIVVVVRGGWGS